MSSTRKTCWLELCTRPPEETPVLSRSAPRGSSGTNAVGFHLDMLPRLQLKAAVRAFFILVARFMASSDAMAIGSRAATNRAVPG